MYFNVPQSRQRLIFIGVRNDLGIAPSHPEAESKPIIVRDAVVGITNNDDERRVLLDAGRKHGAYDIWDKLLPGGNGRFGDHYRVDDKKVSRTLGKFSANLGIRGTMHWAEKRRMTSPEYKRLSAFPDGFLFGNWNQTVTQIGNSVPPLMMRSIARHVRTEMLDTPVLQPAA